MSRRNWYNSDIVTAVLVFAVVMAVIVALSVAVRGASTEALGASSSAGTALRLSQPTSQATSAQRLATSASFHSSVCRIQNAHGNQLDVGSGMLIEKNADGSRGVVLTCGHLFADGVGQVVVAFPDGRTHGARLLAVDRQADLAALLIANPAAQPAKVSEKTGTGGPLTACGFGPSGVYRCTAGRLLGHSQATGQENLMLEGAVRSGDSGGAVFDARGRLVAVVWGESCGVTYASTGGPLRRFLAKVLGRPLPHEAYLVPKAVCPGGTCPVPRQPQGQDTNPDTERLDQLARQIEALETNKQDRGEYLTRGDLKAYLQEEQLPELDRFATQQDIQRVESESAARHESILSRIHAMAQSAATGASGISLGKAAGTAAVGLLGLSGPAGWAVVAAAAVGGGLLGRYLKKRKGGSSRLATGRTARKFRKSQHEANQTEQSQPVEREDREARELLQLSQLEGRDPLQDALAGRLALDRLDAIAESDRDPPAAAWADRLRRELRERFNEVAPTKFTVGASC